MRRGATNLGDDAQDGLRVQRRGLGGSQIAGHQDDRALERGHARLGQATQLADRTVAHVVQVGRALRHVAAQAAQHLRVVLNSVMDGLGQTQTLLELLVNGLGQTAVARELSRGLQDCLRLFRRLCRALTQARGNGSKRLTDARAVGGSINAARLRRVNAGCRLDNRGGRSSGTGGNTDAVQNVVRRH